MDVGKFFVEQANNRVLAFADKEFVSWKGKVRPGWFAQRPMPADAWENTEEGKRAMAEQAEWEAIRRNTGV
jgi:hypothetical protein